MKSGKNVVKIDIGFGMVIALVMALGAAVILNATQGDRAYDQPAQASVAANVQSMRGYASAQSESRLEPGKSEAAKVGAYQGEPQSLATRYNRPIQLK